MQIDQQFNSISDKLQLLLKQHARLQKENDRLREENIVARKKEDEALKLIEDYRQQVSILKLGSPAMDDRDKKEFEKKINQYIREIDRCISFLSQ